jgi:serine/threonine protein kinase/tetratricopeptide (TPR) repeat protein
VSLSVDKFGKYHVLGRLAQGGMAEIYKVKTVGLAGFEKLQVLKKILPAHAGNPRFIRSFIDEARIAVSLNHRNIVQVFEFGRVASELFLAMELIEGVNLRDATVAAGRRRQRPGIALACHILAEVAAGLDYAHRRKDHDGRPLGIVHCDVSPQNIALSWEGYVKILDFGVARATFVAVEKGRLRGKPRYMSPEQTRGELPTAATDVFALGVVAWELLCGAPLFDGPDVDSILKAIQRLDLPSPLALNPELPAPLAGAIVRALARDPAARGLASDLGAAFTHAQRELDPQLGARAVARWLAEIFPDSPLNAAAEAEPPSRDGEASPISLLSASTAPGLPDATDLEPPPEPEIPEILEEKRRIVAVACLLDGGSAETRRQARAVLADMAYKHGAVVRDDAPQVVALFGMEIAGDDDVAAALGFVVDAHDAAREAGLALRAGVRPGVARQRRGAGYTVLGDLLDEALALAAAAPPARTWFGGVPGRLSAAGYGFRELGPLRRRGRRMRVHELYGARPAAQPAPPPSGALHGRSRELAGLREAWETTLATGAQVACAIVGDAGIGKTRLCAELAAAIEAEHGEVLRCPVLPGGRDTPYHGAIDLLSLELGLAPARGPAARARLCARLARQLEDAGVLAEERGELVSAVGSALELGAGVAPAAEVPENLRERVALAVTALRGVRDTAPRLIVIDDWHWLDGASAEVLRLVLAAPQPRPQLVVVTARPGPGGESPAWPPTVSPVIRLGELSRADAVALIRERLAAGAGAAQGEDVASIERRAGGNPLFIEELCAAAADLGPHDMPESARSVIAARVDRLPRVAKAALQHAAVLGPAFRGRLLEELLGPSAARGLALLEQAGILARRKGEDGELGFRHGLLMEVVYDSLAGSARREAHRRIGTLLSEHYEAGRVKAPEAIARHLELGGDAARAAIFYLRAGKLELAAGGATAAVRAFTRALELGLGAAEREREALFGREAAAGQLGDTVQQRRDLEALARLSAGDDRRLAEVAVRSARLHLRVGALDAALAEADAADAAALRAHDERARAEALRVCAEARQRLGQPDRALDAAGRALEIQRRLGAPGDEARTLVVAGRVHLLCLEIDAALACYRPALLRARAAGDHWLERRIGNHLAVAHLLRGELADAVDRARQALELALRSGDRGREGDSAALLGAVLLELGRPDEARGWIGHALERCEQTGARLSRADTLIVAGRLECAVGDLALAFGHLEESLAIAGAARAAHPLAGARNELVLALLRRRAAGDLARAERHAEEAAELARDARLLGCEIVARSRAALAILEAGDARAALAPSSHALHLLERARACDGPAEEIWLTHHRILDALGDPSARAALERAHAGYIAKLSRLDGTEWHDSYDDAELSRQIRAAWLRA